MLVRPAHETNFYTDRVCKPIAFVWHEPQEPADNYESTPVWFATYHPDPNQRGSTTYYGDNDGDRYQCVPIDRAPIANGWTGDRPIPRFNDGGPEFGAYSLNEQSHSSEEEGYSHNIQQTFTDAQYRSAVDLGALFLIMYDLPRNPLRVGLAHADVASNRSDGIWIARKSGIPQEAVNKVLTMEKDIQELKALAWKGAVKDNGQDVILVTQALKLNKYEVHTAHPPGK